MAFALPNLSLGISPVSSAAPASGMKMFGDTGGTATGSINVGSGAGGGDSWFSGVVRDFVIGAGVVIGIVYVFGKMK